MLPEIEERLQALERRRARLLADYAELSEAQLRFRPAEGAWSLLEVAEHLMIAESGSTAAIEKRGGGPAVRSLRQRLLGRLVAVVLTLGFKVRAPSRRLLPQGKLSLDELGREWQAVGGRLRAALEQVGPGELRNEAFRHPISGPLDFRQGLDFLARHFDHHLRQVGRIRAAPGFPAAGSPQ